MSNNICIFCKREVDASCSCLYYSINFKLLNNLPLDPSLIDQKFVVIAKYRYTTVRFGGFNEPNSAEFTLTKHRYPLVRLITNDDLDDNGCVVNKDKLKLYSKENFDNRYELCSAKVKKCKKIDLGR